MVLFSILLKFIDSLKCRILKSFEKSKLGKIVRQRQEPPVKDSTTQIAEGLNFRVRDGYGCNPLAMVAYNNPIGLNSYKGYEG